MVIGEVGEGVFKLAGEGVVGFEELADAAFMA
jgi:hypothetical protein